MVTGFKKWKWKCPICEKVGKHILSHTRSKRNGKSHMEKYHNSTDDPIIIKVR